MHQTCEFNLFLPISKQNLTKQAWEQDAKYSIPKKNHSLSLYCTMLVHDVTLLPTQAYEPSANAIIRKENVHCLRLRSHRAPGGLEDILVENAAFEYAASVDVHFFYAEGLSAIGRGEA